MGTEYLIGIRTEIDIGMLYVMRHGKTQWNELHKIQGQTDTSLNDEGRMMAEAAREKYKDMHFDICYVSPLLRARETAEIFLKGRDIPVIYDERLKEMCFGSYEGEMNAIERNLPIAVFFKDPADYVAADGVESIEQLMERTESFLEEYVYPQLKKGKDILIIGHGAMNSSIVCNARGMSKEHFWDAGIPNCEVILVDVAKPICEG